jgi:hypothetical protein
MLYYENKTNQSIWKYTISLPYNRCKPPTYFGQLLWPSTGRCFTKDILYITRTTKSMYKYKILSFKWFSNMCWNIQNIDKSICVKFMCVQCACAVCCMQTQHHHLSWMLVQHAQNMKASYPSHFSTNSFICTLYILKYIVNHTCRT